MQKSCGVKPIFITDYSHKKIAVDTSIILYQSVITIRNSGSDLLNKKGELASHILGLFNKTIELLNVNNNIIEFKNEEDKNNFILYINFLKQFISNTVPFDIDNFVRKLMDYKKQEIENKKQEIENKQKEIENFQYLFNVFKISQKDYNNIDESIKTYEKSRNLSNISYFLLKGESKKELKDKLKKLLLNLFEIDQSIPPQQQIYELKKKYRKMAMKYHPDKSTNIETKNKNHVVFQFLNKINTLLNEILE